MMVVYQLKYSIESLSLVSIHVIIQKSHIKTSYNLLKLNSIDFSLVSNRSQWQCLVHEEIEKSQVSWIRHHDIRRFTRKMKISDLEFASKLLSIRQSDFSFLEKFFLTIWCVIARMDKQHYLKLTAKTNMICVCI